MKKMDLDVLSYIKTSIMGLVGIIAWLYSNSKGVTGKGMELALTLSTMYLLISILGIILTNFVIKKPLKNVGVVNKRDEMFVNIRGKAAELTIDILNAIVFTFIILTCTDILVIKFEIYYLGIIAIVGLNVINMICTSIASKQLL